MPLEKRKEMFDAEEKTSINKQCKLLKINRNYFYYQPKSESEENEKIIQLLKGQYVFTPFYGYRKIAVWLQKQGFLVNEKRVRRLMKKTGWQRFTELLKRRLSIKNIKNIRIY